MKWVGFDLEIANEFPAEGNPLDSDLGITCASTVTSDGDVITWPAPCHMLRQPADAMYPARLSTDMCAAIVGRLLEYNYVGPQVGRRRVQGRQRWGMDGDERAFELPTSWIM